MREVVAAKAAGMHSLIIVREGNSPLSEGDREGQVVVSGFDEVEF